MKVEGGLGVREGMGGAIDYGCRWWKLGMYANFISVKSFPGTIHSIRKKSVKLLAYGIYAVRWEERRECVTKYQSVRRIVRSYKLTG